MSNFVGGHITLGTLQLKNVAKSTQICSAKPREIQKRKFAAVPAVAQQSTNPSTEPKKKVC